MTTDTAIVITTINPPGKAIRAFARQPHTSLIVVGDRKSPPDWQCEGARFVSMEEQFRSRFALAQALPANHYCRKMIGYLLAMEAGATVIVDTDDDNIPKPNWGFPDFEGTLPVVEPTADWMNIYSAFTTVPVWPRGFPLDAIRDPATRIGPAPRPSRPVQVGIWQGLADGDPDVDAIYRMLNPGEVWFEDAFAFVLDRGAFTPFNSQNTAFRREVFPLLYLPACVSFRYTDILRSYVAQPVLWAMGLHVGITGATVVQERNVHNLMSDFESEIPCYTGGRRVRHIAEQTATPDRSPRENLELIYTELVRQLLVPPEELPLLQAWFADIDRLMS